MRSRKALTRRINGSERRALAGVTSVLAVLGVLGCSADGFSSDGGGGAAGTAGFAGQMQQMGNGFPNNAGGQAGMSTLPANGGGMGGTLGAGGMIPQLGAGGAPSGVGGSQFGMGGTFGAGGAAGMFGASGMFGAGGMLGAGGMFGMNGGMQGGGGSSGAAGMAGMSSMDMETGRLVGITAEHNAVRAAVQTQPPLPPLTWSPTIAQYAQQWADSLAMTSCSSPHHRSQQDLVSKGYGENLAAFGSSTGGSTAKQAVDGWAGEEMCWTYGTVAGTEKCDMACYSKMNSDGCGHYTQIVWRKSTQLGCGVATCQNGLFKMDIWICNYAPAGNFVGQTPY